jgi:hypothetical protein
VSLTAQEVAATGRRPDRWQRLLRPGLAVAALAAATAYVAAVDPDEPGHYPLCPTYALAGISCPGCGMLRATHALTHGDLGTAMQRNPLVVPILLGVAAVLLLWVRSAWTGRAVHWEPPRWMPWALAAAFVVVTVARNVPGWTWASPA